MASSHLARLCSDVPRMVPAQSRQFGPQGGTESEEPAERFLKADHLEALSGRSHRRNICRQRRSAERRRVCPCVVPCAARTEGAASRTAPIRQCRLVSCASASQIFLCSRRVRLGHAAETRCHQIPLPWTVRSSHLLPSESFYLANVGSTTPRGSIQLG